MYESIQITKKIKQRLQNLDTYVMLDQVGLGYPKLNETVFLFNENDTISSYSKDYICKRDLMVLFDIGSAKALSLLKLMQQIDMAFQLGKEYYTTKKKLEQFIDEQMGNTIIL